MGLRDDIVLVDEAYPTDDNTAFIVRGHTTNKTPIQFRVRVDQIVTG